MARSKLMWTIPLVLTFVLGFVPNGVGEPRSPNPDKSAPPKAKAATSVEVTFLDGSSLKLQILDEKLEFVTEFGTLQIPVAKIKKIFFATRVPTDLIEKYTKAITSLNDASYDVREAATKELKEGGRHAYIFAGKAAKSEDPEISRRGTEIVKYLESQFTSGQLEVRENDTLLIDVPEIHVSGHITADQFRVNTKQFGELDLKLPELTSLSVINPAASPAVPDAPVNLTAFKQKWNKELTFKITGRAMIPGQTPNIWGTGTYTIDSDLSFSAVHSGVLKAGETKAVTVKVIESPVQYVGSYQNDTTSLPFPSSYRDGAYIFLSK